MSKYDVYVFCDECSVPHPTGIVINIDDGPRSRASIADLYANRNLPPEISQICNKQTICPKTGKSILQRDRSKIYLLAIN